MAWYNLVTYTPPATATALGAVGGGWTDSGSQWQVVTLSGTAGDTALKTVYNTSSPWQNAGLVRRATAEQTNNLRVSIRWLSNGSSISNAAEILARFDTSGNGLIARMSQVWALAANATSGSSTNGTNSTFVTNTWYDTQITWVTSGSTTTITEKSWTVANELTSAFGSGSLNSPAAGNVYTSTLYPNVTAAAGIYFYQPSTNGGFIKFFASDTDIPSTTISLTPATTTVNVGTATTYTVTAGGAQNGGALTLSDGGKGGTFAPASPTLPTGLGATVTYTYTPATSGAITLTVSSAALTGTTITATASVTANLTPATALSVTPTSINVNAGSASASYTVGTNGSLASNTTVTLSDSGAGGTFTPTSLTLTAGNTPSATFTYTPPSGSSSQTNTLTIAASGLTSVTANAVVTQQAQHFYLSPLSQNVQAGIATGNYTVSMDGFLSSALTVTPNDSGAGGTFTPTTMTIAAGNGNTATFTYTPLSTLSAQTVTLTLTAPGIYAVTGNAVVSAAPVAPTALTLTPSNQTLSPGTPATFTVGVNSGTFTGSKAVTLSDSGAGGTFTPSGLTLPTGSTPTATFTYVNSTVGTYTLTASGTSLTSAAATATVSTSNVVTPNNTAIVRSANNWVTGVANSTTGDNSAMRTWYTGAYLRIIVQGTTSLGIAFGTCFSGATFDYTIDEKEIPQPITITSNSTYTITLPSTGIHLVIFKLQSISQTTGRWAGTTSIVINGFILGSGGSTLANPPNSKRLLVYGDSITEGTQSRDGSDGMTTGYAFAFCEAMRKTKNFEYSIKGAGYSGLAWATPAANGGQPPAWTSGNDAQSSYNKVDGSGAAGALLTTGTPGSASELFITQPDLIVINWGTNDGNQGIANATVQATTQGLLAQLRVCAPNAIIVVIVPFGGQCRAPLTAAVAAMTDGKTILVDPSTDSRMTTTFYCGNYVSGTAGTQTTHPWSWGSAQLASIVTRLVSKAYEPFGVARSYGNAS